MKTIFEFAVIYNPPAGSKKEEEAKFLVKPQHILAANVEEVRILAAREIPKEYLSRLECVQVAVRPF